MSVHYYLSKIMLDPIIDVKDLINLLDEYHLYSKTDVSYILLISKLPIIFDRLIKNNQFDDFLNHPLFEEKIIGKNVSHFLSSLVRHPLALEKIITLLDYKIQFSDYEVILLESMQYTDKNQIKNLLYFYKNKKMSSFYSDRPHAPDFYLLFNQYPEEFKEVFKLKDKDCQKKFFSTVVSTDTYALCILQNSKEEFVKWLTSSYHVDSFKETTKNGLLDTRCENNLIHLFHYYPDVYQKWFDRVSEMLRSNLNRYLNHLHESNSNYFNYFFDYCKTEICENIFLDQNKHEEKAVWSKKTSFKKWYEILCQMILIKQENVQGLALNLIRSFKNTIIMQWIAEEVLSEKSIFNQFNHELIAVLVLNYWRENNLLNFDDQRVCNFIKTNINEEFNSSFRISDFLFNDKYQLSKYQQEKLFSIVDKKDLYIFFTEHLDESFNSEELISNDLNNLSILNVMHIINLSILYDCDTWLLMNKYPDFKDDLTLENKPPQWLKNPTILLNFLGEDETKNLIGFVDFFTTSNPEMTHKSALGEYLIQYSKNVLGQNISIDYDNQHDLKLSLF